MKMIKTQFFFDEKQKKQNNNNKKKFFTLELVPLTRDVACSKLQRNTLSETNWNKYKIEKFLCESVT